MNSFENNFEDHKTIFECRSSVLAIVHTDCRTSISDLFTNIASSGSTYPLSSEGIAEYNDVLAQSDMSFNQERQQFDFRFWLISGFVFDILYLSSTSQQNCFKVSKPMGSPV